MGMKSVPRNLAANKGCRVQDCRFAQSLSHWPSFVVWLLPGIEAAILAQSTAAQGLEFAFFAAGGRVHSACCTAQTNSNASPYSKVKKIEV